jgi:hypothetical protein
VPIAPLNANLLGHRILRTVSKPAAERYASLVHRSLTHVNVWPVAQWTDLVRTSGLVVERAEPILSPAATKAFEALLPAAYANRLWRKATGARPPHPDLLVRAVEKRIWPLVREGAPDGSNLFVVARKPG